MSAKELGIVLAIGGAATIAFFAGKSQAVESPPAQPLPTIPPANPPATPANPPAGNGNSTPPSLRLNLLPPELQNINLSGQEQYIYDGTVNVDQSLFDRWTVHNTLNGMDMRIFRAVASPDDWISLFIHQDPPGSDPSQHYIVYKESDSPGKQFMLDHIFAPGP